MATEDSAKNFNFQAIGLEHSKLPVQFPKKDYVKTSRKELEKVQKRFIENPMDYISNSIINKANADIQLTANKDKFYLNNTLKLEGGWNNDSGTAITNMDAVSQHLDKPN